MSLTYCSELYVNMYPQLLNIIIAIGLPGSM